MAAPSEKGKSVVKQYEKLKAIRQPLDQEYRDAYKFTYPSLGAGFNQGDDLDGITTAQRTKTEQAQLFDSTGTDAVRLLSSSVLSSMTPPASLWFELAPGFTEDEDLDQEGKEWLKDSAIRIHKMIHASNYDTEALEFIMHQMIAGMAGLYIELKGNKFRFETWPLNHLFCQETLNDGYIDTVYRAFNYTLQEAVLQFGLDSLPDHMKEAYKADEFDTKLHRFVVGIRPRIIKGKQATGRTSKMLPWESIWVANCGTVVKESGFEEMPVIVPRWLKIPDTDYARGPVFDALPDMKTLNMVKGKMLVNMDMHIAGSYLVKDDGVVNPANIHFGARRIIPVGDMDSIKPLQTGGDIQFAVSEIASLQGSIRRMLLADQLGPTEKAIQTATEVQTRNNQVRQILGPIFARLQSEFLTHLVTRCFGLTIRANLLPPVPDSIRNGSGTMEVGYRSPLARSQKMTDLNAIDEWTRRAVALVQIKPELLDNMDFDLMTRHSADLLGVDPELVVLPDVVKKIRSDRAKAQQAAKQQEQQAAMAEAQAKQPPAPTNPQSAPEMVA